MIRLLPLPALTHGAADAQTNGARHKKKGDLDKLRSPFLFRVFRAHDRKGSVAML